MSALFFIFAVFYRPFGGIVEDCEGLVLVVIHLEFY